MSRRQRVRFSLDTGFLPLLEEWKKLEVRKVRERIASVEGTIKSQETGPVIVCLKAQKCDTDCIAKLVERTILEVYPRYYSKDVTDFFLILHNEYRIKADIEDKNVWMLLCDGKLVGTGSMKGNHITRVYVIPEKQGQGFGSRIMDELESRIRKNFDSVELDASLPAEAFYERRGYKTVKHESLSIGESGMTYKVMEKIL